MRIFSPLVFCLILIYSNTAFTQPVFRNLVFEGGGIRGIAYSGALQELEERNLLNNVQRVGGTSAGAIAATLIAIGCSPQEIADKIADLNIKKFADGRGVFIGGTKRLFKYYGWYKGEKFDKWMAALIKEKTGNENLTFAELHQLAQTNKKFKELFITGTNLSSQKLSIFCNATYPNMEIKTAVRISISIPLFYQAVVIDPSGKIIKKKKDHHKGDLFVDGGIIANFPIQLFDYACYRNGFDSTRVVNEETIGFRLDRQEQIEFDRQKKGLAPFQINKFKDYVDAFYTILIESLNRQNLSDADWQRTVSINTDGIGPKIRKLSQVEKDSLIQNGRKGVMEFLKE